MLTANPSGVTAAVRHDHADGMSYCKVKGSMRVEIAHKDPDWVQGILERPQGGLVELQKWWEIVSYYTNHIEEVW